MTPNLNKKTLLVQLSRKLDDYMIEVYNLFQENNVSKQDQYNILTSLGLDADVYEDFVDDYTA